MTVAPYRVVPSRQAAAADAPQTARCSAADPLWTDHRENLWHVENLDRLLDRCVDASLSQHFKMPTDLDHVRADFDRIARLDAQSWEMDDGCVERLLERVPDPCGRALEVGCGTGRVTRRLAERCREVVAVDASPEMIRVAAERSGKYANVRYEQIDFERFDAAPGSFDAVVSVNTLHHLPLRSSLARMRDCVAAGGELLILDVGWPQGLRGLGQRALAFPLSLVLRIWHTGRLRLPPDLRAAWDAHLEHDEYPVWEELRAVVGEELPGCHLKPHLFWRYSLTWRAPCST